MKKRKKLGRTLECDKGDPVEHFSMVWLKSHRCLPRESNVIESTPCGAKGENVYSTFHRVDVTCSRCIKWMREHEDEMWRALNYYRAKDALRHAQGNMRHRIANLFAAPPAVRVRSKK